MAIDSDRMRRLKARSSRKLGLLPLPVGGYNREVGSPSPPPSPRWGEGVPPCRVKTPCSSRLPDSTITSCADTMDDRTHHHHHGHTHGGRTHVHASVDHLAN